MSKPNPWNRVMFAWCTVVFIFAVRAIITGHVPEGYDPELMTLARATIAAVMLDLAVLNLCRWIQAEVTYYRNKEGRY